MSEFPVTIYHNPKCGTSRNAVAMAKAAGYEPQIVPYLTVGWSPDLLRDLAARTGLGVRGLVRQKGTPAEELGLLKPGVSDETIVAAMVEHPILVNRPIVVTPKGAALARPSERIFDLLEHKPDSYTKEDGEVVRLS